MSHLSHRIRLLVVLGVLLALTAACTNKKSQNPLAGVGSKQPDKVLFDKAMDAMKHNRFDVARLTLQTLINTYPDSEYIARAKLAVGDSWYAEGGTAALAQAEQGPQPSFRAIIGQLRRYRQHRDQHADKDGECSPAVTF